MNCLGYSVTVIYQVAQYVGDWYTECTVCKSYQLFDLNFIAIPLPTNRVHGESEVIVMDPQRSIRHLWGSAIIYDFLKWCTYVCLPFKAL